MPVENSQLSDKELSAWAGAISQIFVLKPDQSVPDGGPSVHVHLILLTYLRTSLTLSDSFGGGGGELSPHEIDWTILYFYLSVYCWPIGYCSLLRTLVWRPCLYSCWISLYGKWRCPGLGVLPPTGQRQHLLPAQSLQTRQSWLTAPFSEHRWCFLYSSTICSLLTSQSSSLCRMKSCHLLH